jgi:hypothetical protein
LGQNDCYGNEELNTLILLTPTGSEDAHLEDTNGPLYLRAALIRMLAVEYGFHLADVCACWQQAIEAGTKQKESLSQPIIQIARDIA